MSGWKPKKGTWWKPIAEPKSIGYKQKTVVTQVGPSSFRYEPAKKTYDPPAKFTPVYGRNHRKTYWGQDDGYDEDRPVVKKKYSWTPTRWSSFSWNSVVLDDDDNSELFVKEPESYMTPTVAEIKAKINIFGKSKFDRIKDLCRVCYFKMIDEKDYIAEMWKEKEGDNFYEKRKAMCDNVYETFLPGHTPLEQAIAIHHKLEDIEATANRTKYEHTLHKSRRFEFDRDDYCDPAINTQLDLNELSKKRKMEILNKISIIGDLGNQFKVEKETSEKEVANSHVYRKRIMRDYEQFTRTEVYQKLFPNFRARFLTKDLVVNIPVQTSEKKQKIIILCDYSGSMNETEKQVWVNALLIDRCRYVIRGEAELYFSFFVNNPNHLEFTHLKNAKDVIEFWKTFSNYPSGSMTDIGRIVTYVSDEIKKGRLKNLNIDLSKERPEILIINDGQDRVGYDSFPYKVNAISLMEFSNELKNLCVATGGKQIEITEENRIFAYSKEEEKGEKRKEVKVEILKK